MQLINCVRYLLRMNFTDSSRIKKCKSIWDLHRSFYIRSIWFTCQRQPIAHFICLPLIQITDWVAHSLQLSQRAERCLSKTKLLLCTVSLAASRCTMRWAAMLSRYWTIGQIVGRPTHYHYAWLWELNTIKILILLLCLLVFLFNPCNSIAGNWF